MELEAPAGYLKAAGVAFVAENPKLEPDAGFVRQVQMTDKRVPVQSDPSGMLVCASDAPFGLVVAGGAFAAAALMLAAALRQRLPAEGRQRLRVPVSVSWGRVNVFC